jgi:dolichol-phosphate mannosyltransferase
MPERGDGVTQTLQQPVSSGSRWIPSVARQPSLSIVLPAFNEEDNIEGAVEEAREVAERLARAWEVIVVDDGSRDTTAARVLAISQEEPRVRLISFPRNRGYGAALREGFGAAQGDLIFYTDSDRQFDMNELRYFLPLMERTDVALGFRVYRYDAVLRCVLSWIFNRLVSLLFRVRVRDVDCSFKLFRREVLETIDLETTDFFIDTELVAKARKWNFGILEKGVRHYPRRAGESAIRAGHIPRTLATIARMWIRLYLPPLSSRGRLPPVCSHLREPMPVRSPRKIPTPVEGHNPPLVPMDRRAE